MSKSQRKPLNPWMIFWIIMAIISLCAISLAWIPALSNVPVSLEGKAVWAGALIFFALCCVVISFIPADATWSAGKGISDSLARGRMKKPSPTED